MLVGIVSDTHDDMDAIRKLVDVFNSAGVSHVLHAGDIVSPFTFEVLDGLKCPFTGIFGNNDGDRLLLKKNSKGSIHTQPHIVGLEGRNIVMVHEPLIVDALAESGRFDLVIYGHTHTPEIRRVKNTLVINPGKAARLHKGTATYAMFDLQRMEGRIVELAL